MLWIAYVVIIVAVLLIIATVLFVQGTDQRRTNETMKIREDDEQEKAMSEYRKKKTEKHKNEKR